MKKWSVVPLAGLRSQSSVLSLGQSLWTLRDYLDFFKSFVPFRLVSGCGCIGCLETGWRGYLFRTKWLPRSRAQVWLSARLTATSPGTPPLPRLQESTPSPSPQPWVRVCIQKVLWTRFSEERLRHREGKDWVSECSSQASAARS